LSGIGIRRSSGSTGLRGSFGFFGASGLNGADGATGEQGFGIFLTGQLKTLAGRDRVDARNGGFGGGGKILLGKGNDSAFGFGDVTINGQKGRDKLSLPGTAADYTRSRNGRRRLFSQGGTTMTVIGVETISFLG
jgi:hypothetical protein